MTFTIKPYTPTYPVTERGIPGTTITITGWSDGSIRFKDEETDEVMDFSEKQARLVQQFLDEWQPEEGDKV